MTSALHKKWLHSALIAAVLSTATYAEEDKKDKKEEKKTLTSILEKQTAMPGLLDMYRSEKDGKGYLVLEDKDFNTPILYAAQTVNGALDAGHFKGAYRGYAVVEFRRYFNRIDIVYKTPRFYFDPESAVSKAADANISEAVLVSAKIDKQEDGRYAIKLADVFMSEKLHKIAPNANPDPKAEKKRFKPGKFSKSKSRLLEINNFPNNTHVIMDYVFENANPKVRGGQEVSDPRYVSVQLQHAFMALPDNDFKPRRDDSRLGYFSQQFDDLTSDQTANFRDYINRWDLVKKDPSAAVSDPVKPITWWIENTTPVEWRETIKQATLAWNSSFEKAGISNAIEVKIQPDDAIWSAEDMRYNVLRWTSSPRPPFGGYGPSIANPLTGEIIAADIMLEYTFMKGRWLASKMFTEGHESISEQWDNLEETHCSIGHTLNQGLLFGQAAGLIDGMGDIEKDKLLKQSMYYLILHEVGHTLGLNHNMKATQLHDHKEAHDANVTQGILAGSVMDYPSVNYAPVGMEQGDFYTEKPGPYDDWVINYGYSIGLEDARAEEARLNDILAHSTEPQLAFGNDADDMRAPGRHIDPRINIFDMSSNAVAYATDRLELIKHVASTLKDKTLKAGRSHNDLLVGANVLFGEFARQGDVISRYIGGIYVERGLIGQEGYSAPFTPTPANTQKAAMNSLKDYLFAPDAIANMEPLYAYLQRQRRGFSQFGKNEDPHIHKMLLGAQTRALKHILHPNVLERITDTQLYGNTYSAEKVVKDLTDAIFAADARKSVNTYRRNLQAAYVDMLIKISGLEGKSRHNYIAQGIAIYELDRILDIAKSSKGSQATKIHRNFLKDRIGRAFHKSKS